MSSQQGRRDRISRALTEARLEPYLLAAQGNRRDAIRLYRWNLRASAAVYEQLSVIEVVLRNAMDAELRAWHKRETGDPDWLLVEHPQAPLGSRTAGKRRQAKQQAQRAQAKRAADHHRYGRAVGHDDVLANTTFGLWKDLLPNHAPNAGNNVENRGRQVLWGQALCRAFPNADDPEGRQVHQLVAGLHALRNRVSHMEPLLNANLEARVRDGQKLMGFIDAEVSHWLSGQSRVPQIVRERPL